MDLIPGGSDRFKGIDSATDAMRPRLFGLCFLFYSILFSSVYMFDHEKPEVFDCTVGFRSTFSYMVGVQLIKSDIPI